MTLRGLKSRLLRLEREAKKASVPTPEEYLEAHRRRMARLHEKCAADLGDPGGPLVSEEDRAILADDTPEQRRKDEGIIEAWRKARGISRDVITAHAEQARARILDMKPKDMR